MTKHSMLNGMQICWGFDPGLDIATTRNSDWISLAGYGCAIFILQMEDGAAANDVTITLRQAKTASGGDAKALIPRRWLRKSGANVETIAQPTEVAPSGTAGSATAEGSENNLVYVEVDASELDVNDDFEYVSLRADAAGGVGKLGACIAIAGMARQMTDPVNLVSAIA